MRYNFDKNGILSLNFKSLYYSSPFFQVQHCSLQVRWIQRMWIVKDLLLRLKNLSRQPIRWNFHRKFDVKGRKKYDNQHQLFAHVHIIMQTPFSHSKSGQIEVLVPKDAQCSETHTETILRFFKIFSFNEILIIHFWDFRQKISKKTLLLFRFH